MGFSLVIEAMIEA
jgi:hypothetical protein